MNWANILTALRAALIVPITWAFSAGDIALAIVLYIVAALTDFFDGKVARKYGLASEFGAKFDGTVDVFFLISIFVWTGILTSSYEVWIYAGVAMGALLLYALFCLFTLGKIVSLHTPVSRLSTAVLFSSFPFVALWPGLLWILSVGVILSIFGRIEAVFVLTKNT